MPEPGQPQEEPPPTVVANAEGQRVDLLESEVVYLDDLNVGGLPTPDEFYIWCLEKWLEKENRDA